MRISDWSSDVCSSDLFSQRHADRVAYALAQRPGRGFNARRNTHFRMTRRARMQLPEVFQFVYGQIVARQMQQRVNKHGAVAIGQHEAVAAGPGRIGRIVTQMEIGRASWRERVGSYV